MISYDKVGMRSIYLSRLVKTSDILIMRSFNLKFRRLVKIPNPAIYTWGSIFPSFVVELVFISNTIEFELIKYSVFITVGLLGASHLYAVF